MDAKEITRNLIIGQANLDQMKKDTHQLITMLASMILKAMGNQEESVFLEFKSEGVDWRVDANGLKERQEAIAIKSRDPFVTIWCFCNHSNGSTRTYDSTSGMSSMSNVGLVQTTFESLPNLVSSLIKTLPKLSEEFAPFLKASEVKF